MGYSVNRRYLVFLSCLWHVYFVWVLWLKVSIIDLYGHFFVYFFVLNAVVFLRFRIAVWRNCEKNRAFDRFGVCGNAFRSAAAAP